MYGINQNFISWVSTFQFWKFSGAFEVQEIHPVLNTAGLGRFMKGKLVYKSAEIVFEPGTT